MTYQLWWCRRRGELRPLVVTLEEWPSGVSCQIGNTNIHKDTSEQCLSHARELLTQDGAAVVRVEVLSAPHESTSP